MGIVTRTAAEELTPGQKRHMDARLAEGLADIKAGRVHGPFSSAKETSDYIEQVIRVRKATEKTTRTIR